jgi:butyrate response factor 1
MKLRRLLTKKIFFLILALKKSEDFIHSDDNDSLDEFNTTKANKSITRKSSTTSSVVSTETAGEEKKQKSLYKTELCRNWEETGHCRYGIKCQYAHGASDLREIDRHPKYKTQKCRTFHHTGACPYGARCNFRHFNLPGDALEMKNLEKEEKEEEEKKRQQSQQKEVAAAVPSLFSAAIDHQNVPLQQNWFLESPLAGPGHQIPTKMNTNYDSEDSLLPSNAESLLPHQLLFDLESPDKEEEPARCPLRNYVNLPSFSQFQVPSYHPPQYQQPQQMNQQQCKTFFRPWLF